MANGKKAAEVDPVDPAVVIAESASEVAAAKAVFDAALAKHADVVAANTPPEPQPELGKHIYVDLNASGQYALMTLEDAKIVGYRADAPDRTLNIFGANVEHTDTHPSGVWCYRKM